MFVQNRSMCSPKLARSRVDDDLAIAAIVVETAFVRDKGAWVVRNVPRGSTDPPDTTEQPLWEGTSVTAAGAVPGPDRPPYLARIALSVGETTTAIHVFGDRVWVRTAGKLAATPAARFEQKPLSWALAFGGRFDLPPGLCPVRRLPHPGGHVKHPLNPLGVGYYASERAAEGQPLPSIEWASSSVPRWEDPPAPAGLSPCPDLPGLRLGAEVSTAAFESPESRVALQCRLRHAAPGPLIFSELRPGTPLLLKGARREPLAFAIPPSPVEVAVRRSTSSTVVPFGTRWVHIDVDKEVVRVCHAHSFGYRPTAPPASVAVRNA